MAKWSWSLQMSAATWTKSANKRNSENRISITFSSYSESQTSAGLEYTLATLSRAECGRRTRRAITSWYMQTATLLKSFQCLSISTRWSKASITKSRAHQGSQKASILRKSASSCLHQSPLLSQGYFWWLKMARRNSSVRHNLTICLGLSTRIAVCSRVKKRLLSTTSLLLATGSLRCRRTLCLRCLSLWKKTRFLNYPNVLKWLTKQWQSHQSPRNPHLFGAN